MSAHWRIVNMLDVYKVLHCTERPTYLDLGFKHLICRNIRRKNPSIDLFVIISMEILEKK